MNLCFSEKPTILTKNSCKKKGWGTMTEPKGIVIKDLLGLSEPAIRLIECVSRGIGKMYEPTYVKKMAKAKSEELKIISSIVSENINLPVKYSNGEITVDGLDADELMKRTGSRLMFQELQKQQNIDSVVGNAYLELEHETEVSKEIVDTDWIIRFMNSVEDVSNDEMQKLWGKILAGEIKQPKTFTLRTLDKLRNISVIEARKFEKLSQFVLWNAGIYLIYSIDELMKEYGIDFRDILLLDECGLITAHNLTITLKTSKSIQTEIHNSKILGLIKGVKEEIQNVILNAYKLSDSGTQLFKTFKYEGNREYAVRAIELIKKNLGNDYIVSAHTVIENLDDGRTNYETKDLLIK